jgi:hypothetical protein
MAAEIIQVSTQDLTTQEYTGQDTNLISTFDVNTFLSSSSYIEYFIYDLNQNLIQSDYNFSQYSVQNDGQSAGNNNLSQIIISPEETLINNGFDQGSYITYFNFLNKNIGSDIEQLYITEISADRTEIRLDSMVLSDMDIVEKTNEFVQYRETSEYFVDFYLNFGDNQLLIANNITLDSQDPNNHTILVKLYEPLPEGFDVNSTLWVVTSIEESIAYQVNFEDTPIVIQDTTSIQGPNFNLNIKDQVNNSTLDMSYVDLITTSLTSSTNQLNSLLEEKEIDINVDYTNFSDFIHFSSAQTRLENFYYKASLIEEYSSSIATINSQITGSTSSSISVSGSVALYESKINNIITNFDGYDYYLYYSSGSWAWPKTTAEPPYLLASTGSAAVLSWFGSTNEYNLPLYGGIILSASLFDNTNKDNLLFSIPEYLREDSANQPYELFIDMVAQHFDNIWIYYKDVTNKYTADNRLEAGISKDIVADAIRDFGIKLYQNNFSNNDLFTAFLGLTPDGALFPFPNITSSLPTPSGYEYVNTFISASNDYIPLDDVNKSLYKRIYHNLPYLLKSKGTIPGLRALITSYGIPDTILRISEFGGKDKVNSNDWDYWQEEFNYSYYSPGNNFISIPFTASSAWNAVNGKPSNIEFRFKTDGLPQTNIPYSQSLIQTNGNFNLTLTYTGSGYTSGSYSGSIPDPYNEYATLTFYPISGSFNQTCSVYLPFFNGDWWSVMINKTRTINTTGSFSLYAANKIYEGGNNGTQIGFFASSSLPTASLTSWNSTLFTYFGRGISINGNIYRNFSGSFQEIKYYKTALSENTFKDYVMNPYSIEGNTLNSSPNELIFRLPLGGELYTGSNSVHPKVTGSWVITSSFPTNSSCSFNSTPTFLPNTEYFFYDQPVVGIQNSVSDKIRLEDNVLPSGDTLSAFRYISQNTEASSSYTANTNLLEVAFSPQDEINDDISSQIGYFNIGDYIGDPAFRSSRLTSYPDLDVLRDDYFEKYTKNYDLSDFIRLIKFFDNSLFKMIKDFVPARTSLASGIVIKQHYLERNRYPEPQTSWEDLDLEGTVQPQWNDYNPGTVENFGGGTGGSFEMYNYIANTSQSWNETYTTPSGSVTVVHSSQDEFYNGEFSGSLIVVTTQSLAQAYPLNLQEFDYTPIVYSNASYGLNNSSSFTQEQFLNSNTVPQPGEILMLAPWTIVGFYVTGRAATGESFVKINKFDNNGVDNTVPLGQVTNLRIKYDADSTYTQINILTISEFPSYYLYKVSNHARTDNYVLDYKTIATKTSDQFISTIAIPIFSWASAVGNPSPYGTSYFNLSSGEFTLQNTPNIPLSLTASITTSGSFPSGTGKFDIRLNGDSLIGTTYDVSNPSLVTTISCSYFGVQGDILTLTATTPSNTYPVTLTDATWTITQSTAPNAAEFDSVIFEPNITTPHYYNSDYNPLINNAVDIRQNNLYQDIDYSQGSLVPVNFQQLLTGSATLATVQDSNYTSARHIIPRYEGSKSTSQQLNVWTEGDTGTYGKLPTIESNKVWVAYCETVGGYAPERMNASGLIIKYLIDQDGNVALPNTSENSLSTTQGTFQTGERLTIFANSLNSGQTNYRNIIRGGQRIAPVLYTQIGHTPANWTSSLNLVDNNAQDNITDITALSNINPRFGYSPVAQYITTTEENLGDTSNTGTSSNDGWSILYDPNNRRTGDYYYTVPSSAITQGVNLIIDTNIQIFNSAPDNRIVQVKLNRLRGATITSLQTQNISFNAYEEKGVLFNITLFPQIDILTNDELYFTVQNLTPTSGTGTVQVTYQNTYFNTSQNPLPNPFASVTVATGSIWNYPTSSTYNQASSSKAGVIYIPLTGSALNIYYNVGGVQQQDISSSGFFSIDTDWSVNIGDEFRFEGREDRVFMVKKVFPPTLSSLERISNTGSLEIHLNNSIPSASINLDHFLIRRYVDDPSAIIFEGLKPTNSTGPYLIKPEYVTPSLNKNLDSFIIDLTQKGLL